jgi:rhodanese-related sulfurtransferase
MTKPLALLAAILVLLAPVVAAQAPDLSTAQRIPMEEFQSLFRAGKVLVVDVRDPASYAAGHIPGARSMPLAAILEPANVAVLKAAKQPIVLYCA